MHTISPPHPILTNITISSPTTSTLPSLSRLTRTLLPINYPTKFFTSLLVSPSPENNYSLSKVAIWHDPNATTTDTTINPTTNTSSQAESPPHTQVIGGICGRIVQIPQSQSQSHPHLHPHPGGVGVGSSSDDEPPEYEFYIATLAILSPWRNQGIASALLREVLSAAAAFTSSLPAAAPALALASAPTAGGQGQSLVAVPVAGSGLEGFGAGSLRSVFAHVWETNDEGVEWYRGRGFEIGDVQGGYYRKLRPDGARVVRRDVLGVLVGGGCGGDLVMEKDRDLGGEDGEDGRE